MPLYTYECGACKGVFEISHSIKEDFEKCVLCEIPDLLKRIPAVPFILKKGHLSTTDAGHRVDAFIEKARAEVQQEKKDLKQKRRE